MGQKVIFDTSGINGFQLTFPAIRGDQGQYFALDGKKEIYSHQYFKYVCSFKDLTFEEKQYVLEHYVKMIDFLQNKIEASINETLKVLNERIAFITEFKITNFPSRIDNFPGPTDL